MTTDNADSNAKSNNEQLQASLSALMLSIGSSAAMALGQAPDPASGAVRVDRKMAKFNIDLLLILQEKTKNNLTTEESKLLDSLLRDLQVKFVNVKPNAE